jgi:hypothetical protein
METMTQMKWSVEDTIIMMEYLVANEGKLPDDEGLALRDELFPQRSTGSVYTHAWHNQLALGYAEPSTAGWRDSKQIVTLATLFKEYREEMLDLARDIRLLRRIRRDRPAPALAE